MSATKAEIRRAFVSRIQTLGGDWWSAPVPYDLFGISRVPDAIPAQKAHLAFTVGTPATTEYGWRQTPRDGTLNRTTVGVRFFARNVPADPLASVDVATDAEQALIGRLLTHDQTWPVTFNLEVVSSTLATPAPGNWHLVEVVFRAIHVLALT